MILAKNIHKQFGNLEVLKGVSLEVKTGEIVSIVGESGAGKSTLLQIISSLDRATNPDFYETEIKLDGISIHELNDVELSEFRNKKIGFIFQFHQLLPEFTALENVILPGLIAKRNKKELIEKAEDILKFLNLQNRSHHKPNALSGGEQQRVAVARALINSPKVIFADEPSGNLDSKNAEELHHLFFRLRENFNQTFVIVTHNFTLSEMSDRVITIKDGLLEL